MELRYITKCPPGILVCVPAPVVGAYLTGQVRFGAEGSTAVSPQSAPKVGAFWRGGELGGAGGRRGGTASGWKG